MNSSTLVVVCVCRRSYLGSIPQPAKTYNVMGNANCQGVVIGETTLGGLSELSNVGKDYRNGTILDYGQLIYITLQRAASAREAIDTMASLTAKYGYASDMEGFSISDPSGEVWCAQLLPHAFPPRQLYPGQTSSPSRLAAAVIR